MTSADVVIKNVEDIDIFLEGLDVENITSILSKWKEITDVRRKLDQLEEILKIKIKNYMKERQWSNYRDKETKISIVISTQKNEQIDKTQLKLMLTDAQYSQVLKTTTFEKVIITTPEARERMKKYVMEKKN